MIVGVTACDVAFGKFGIALFRIPEPAATRRLNHDHIVSVEIDSRSARQCFCPAVASNDAVPAGLAMFATLQAKWCNAPVIGKKN